MPLWMLRTNDGNEIYGDDSPFKFVKAEDVSEFTFIPSKISVKIGLGKKLIFFKRHKVEFISDLSGTSKENSIAYYVGYKNLETNEKSVLELNGRIRLIDDDGRND